MGNYLDGYGKEKCNHCEKSRTPEGHDGCIGILDEIVVMNACCGHGEKSMAYVQFWGDEIIEGQKALEYINKNKSV